MSDQEIEGEKNGKDSQTLEDPAAAEEGELYEPGEEKKPSQRKCCPRVKKKQDRYFAIICGVGALVFGTLILGIPSYVVVKAAVESGLNTKTGRWEGFPEKLTNKVAFYQHTKSQALYFGCIISVISGIFIILGFIVISFNACCVKNLVDVDSKNKSDASAASQSGFKHWHQKSGDMELKQRKSGENGE